MNSVAEVLKAKCEELTALVKTQTDLVSQTSHALKQLRAERKLAWAKIQEFNGGILAYSSTLRLMEAGDKLNTPKVEEAPADVAAIEAPAVDEAKVVEGEIVPEIGAAVLD